MLAWLELHQGLAGWAQALGSLVTLLVALYIPYAQRRRAERTAIGHLAVHFLNAITAASLLSLRALRGEHLDADAGLIADFRAHLDALKKAPLVSLGYDAMPRAQSLLMRIEELQIDLQKFDACDDAPSSPNKVKHADALALAVLEGFDAFDRWQRLVSSPYHRRDYFKYERAEVAKFLSPAAVGELR